MKNCVQHDLKWTDKIKFIKTRSRRASVNNLAFSNYGKVAAE